MGVVLSLTSCITARRVNYLQDLRPGMQIEIEDQYEVTIKPYDELSIVVNSPTSQELAAPFNLQHAVSNGTPQYLGTHGGYLVDVNGEIQFPTLGTIRVEGLTRLQLQDTISDMLARGGYITDPFVTVRFSNFKIFFLGGRGCHVLTVDNEHCNFLEAIVMVGGLDEFTRRDRIGVMREVDGKLVMRYLDPRSTDVFNDPFFQLKQNDIIIMEAMNGSLIRSEVNYWLGWGSVLLSTITMLTSLMLNKSVANAN